MKRFVLPLLVGLMTAAQASAQSTGQVSGIVNDGSGAPLSGVAVTVGGAGNLGTLSGQNGRFTVQNVPAGTHQVRASRLGYGEATQSVTVAAGQTATVTFVLRETAVQLEGVVAVGYGTQERRDITGAVASVDAEELTQIPTPSVGEALKGRVAGLDVQTNSYRPGDNPEIRIRGVRSLEASNDPLIVVDGVAIAGGLGDINPQTVASIEVLKDASATAIYGSRGANGVILITTKTGQAGETRVTYDTYYGLQEIHTKVEVFDGAEYAQFRRDAMRTTGRYNCPDGVPACAEGDAAAFSPEELAGIQNGISTDWMDLISQTGAIQNHQLGITGGNENTRFAVSGNYLSERGVTVAQGFLRRGASGSINHNSGRLSAGLSANVTNSLQNLNRADGIWGEAMSISPLAPAFTENGDPMPYNTPWDAQMWNPLVDTEHRTNDRLRTRTYGNAFIGYELLDGINLQTTFGADLNFRREGEFIGALTDDFKGSSNRARVERLQTFNYVSSTQLSANRQLGDAHRVDATILYEIQNQRDDRTEANVQDLPYEYQLYHNIGTAGRVSGVASSFSEWLLQSFMGRLNYIFLDRYYLTFTGRQDCSSRLAPGNKCSFFPSAAAKWRLTDEPFMLNQGLFNDLSIRASYGRTGNTSISPYQTQGSLGRTTYSFAGEGAFGFQPSNIANPALTWEKTDQMDLGLEFALFNSRIAGTADFYIQNTHDLLMERQLPSSVGFEEVLQNVGETRNTGVELSLSTVNLDNWHGLTWTSDIAWTKNKNEIVSLYGGTEDDIGNEWFIGKPIGVHYELEFDGIWQLDEAEEADGYDRSPGDIKVVDQDQDGRFTSDGDRVIIGRHPDFPAWTGSLSNRLTYGAFDLSALATARWGYMVDAGTWPGQMSSRYNQPKLNYWTPENPSNEFPRPNLDSEGAIDAGAVQLMEASHWRVRNITLGYTVPSSLIGQLRDASSLRVYLQAQDPFVFTDFMGFDPEGGEGNGVPSYRTLLVGASLGF
jgi:TonB-linked SusC/RagA family outer membrane protein